MSSGAEAPSYTTVILTKIIEPLRQSRTGFIVQCYKQIVCLAIQIGLLFNVVILHLVWHIYDVVPIKI